MIEDDLTRIVAELRETARTVKHNDAMTHVDVLNNWADRLERIRNEVHSSRLGYRYGDLASVLKKLLPPELYKELLAYLDPLGTFVRQLREGK